MVHKGRRHIPVRGHHAQVSAVLAEQRLFYIVRGFRVEADGEPVAGLAHRRFAAEFIKFKNEIGFCLF